MGLPRIPKQSKAAFPPIGEGTKVRVLAGPFAGRVGSVTELDGKGGARVTFGPLQAHVELANLGPVGECVARPAFHSSHRRFDAPPAAEATSSRLGQSDSKARKPGRRARGK
jgi:hypothetical protein